MMNGVVVLIASILLVSLCQLVLAMVVNVWWARKQGRSRGFGLAGRPGDLLRRMFLRGTAPLVVLYLGFQLSGDGVMSVWSMVVISVLFVGGVISIAKSLRVENANA